MAEIKNRLRKIGADEPVYSIPNYQVEQVFVTNAQTIDWGVKLLGIPNFWKFTKGAGVKVAVLDTGIAFNHPDLIGNILDKKDFTNSQSGVCDENGHGTHVAGIIAAKNNNTGIVGVAPEAKLLIGKVLGDNGSGSSKSVAEGIKWAVKSGADIISMSLGSPYPAEEIREEIEKAIDKNVFVICAAGNSGPVIGTVDYPGAFPNVITVGAVDRRMKIPRFSSRGKELDIVAPGDQIISTYPPRNLAKLSGTSMATPFVSGIVALMLAKHRQFGGATPLQTQEQLYQHLIKATIDLMQPGFDLISGYGLIDPRKLLGDFEAGSITLKKPRL